jgi:hypothetical protein
MSNTYDADHRWQNMCAMLGRLGLDALELAHGRLASDLRSAVTSCQHEAIERGADDKIP